MAEKAPHQDRFLLAAGWTATALAAVCMAAGAAGGGWLLAKLLRAALR